MNIINILLSYKVSQLNILLLFDSMKLCIMYITSAMRYTTFLNNYYDIYFN